MASKFLPLFDRVLVKRLAAETKTAGGILIPESAQQRLNEALVVAVGPGTRGKDGSMVPVSVKIGDTVMVPEYGGNKLKLDGVEHTLFREEDLLGILRK